MPNKKIRLKPFEAIDTLSREARSKRYHNAGMLFYETATGFNFRSLQSMMKADVYATYKYQAKNVDEKTQNIQEKSTTVIDYELSKPYDILNEIRGAVKKWKTEATKIGISKAEISLMSSAFKF